MQSFLAVYSPPAAPPTMTMPMSVSPHSGHQHPVSGLLGGAQTPTTNTGTGATNTAKTTGTMNSQNTATALMAGELANPNTVGPNGGAGNGNATPAPLSTGAQNWLMRPGSSLGLGSGLGADFAGASKSGATDINMGLTVTLATTMGTATPGLGTGKSTPAATPRPVDPVKASVAHLLTKAYSLPCSTAAQAFTHLVQPTARFQLALDALLPLLDVGAVEDGKRRGETEGLEGVPIQLAEVSEHMRVPLHVIDADA